MDIKSRNTSVRRLALAGAVAACLAGVTAHAADNPTKEGYVLSSNGSVVLSGSGECVHTSSWKPSMAIPGCDGYVEKAEPAAAGPAPEPEPIQMAAVTPPKQPTLENVTLNVETLFAFDEATLRPEAREKLDQIADRLGSYPVVTDVQISGYTDRIGAEEYNKSLSERRAQAVADYLSERASAAGGASNMQVRGEGEANPVVTCENTGSAEKLIECLQPNRRVEVNISAREYQNQ